MCAFANKSLPFCQKPEIIHRVPAEVSVLSRDTLHANLPLWDEEKSFAFPSRSKGLFPDRYYVVERKDFELGIRISVSVVT